MVGVLKAQPILTLFVVIGLGYLIGNLSFRGVRRGLAGVLFAGIAAGSLSPNIAVPEVIALLGLIITIYIALASKPNPLFWPTP